MNAAKRSSLTALQPAAPAAAPAMPARRAPAPPDDAQTPEVQSTEVQSPGPREEQPAAAPERAPAQPQRSPRAQRSRTPEVRTPELPKYLRLERKELLIWPDQITSLSVLARTLNRKRGGQGERITTNTLIRVFVTLGLSRAAEMGGTTEEELRRSLGLPD